LRSWNPWRAGVLTGIRQLIRGKPLETQTLEWRGRSIRLPTPAEMLRIKSVLILKRNATRDYLDFLAMYGKLGGDGAADALRPLDELYPQENGESPLQQLIVQLAEPLPYDLEETRLSEYKRLVPKWHNWKAVKRECAACAAFIFDALAEGGR
jgi:hypothetical protein